MNILVIGLGVIGTTYGYLFQKAGHHVEHYIRNNSLRNSVTELKIELLDGRMNPKGIQSSDTYQVNHCDRKTYDFIFVSVPSGGIEDVIRCLERDHISGTIVLCCGIWNDREYVQKLMKGWSYLIGYPVAGGNIKKDTLNACLFDHFMLEKERKTNILNYEQLSTLFSDCKIKLEQPYDMLEWIWIHMAINAAVVSVAGKYGDINDTASAAEQLMASSKMLSEAIRSIRETVKIVASRDVDLKNYKNELLAYKLPTCIAAPIMKRMFAGNILTRKIMTLHGNMNDLLFVCKSLYQSGKSNQIATPVFDQCYQTVLSKIEI